MRYEQEIKVCGGSFNIRAQLVFHAARAEQKNIMRTFLENEM